MPPTLPYTVLDFLAVSTATKGKCKKPKLLTPFLQKEHFSSIIPKAGRILLFCLRTQLFYMPGQEQTRLHVLPLKSQTLLLLHCKF